jgi:succinyl-CoA synthetase alpha subunit
VDQLIWTDQFFQYCEDAVEQAGADTSIILFHQLCCWWNYGLQMPESSELSVCREFLWLGPDMIKANEDISKKGCGMCSRSNCPGVITPGEAKVGINAGFSFSKEEQLESFKIWNFNLQAADQVC